MGSEVVKVKEDPEDLEVDEVMEIMKGMEMAENLGNKSTHLIKME